MTRFRCFVFKLNLTLPWGLLRALHGCQLRFVKWSGGYHLWVSKAHRASRCFPFLEKSSDKVPALISGAFFCSACQLIWHLSCFSFCVTLQFHCTCSVPGATLETRLLRQSVQQVSPSCQRASEKITEWNTTIGNYQRGVCCYGAAPQLPQWFSVWQLARSHYTLLFLVCR